MKKFTSLITLALLLCSLLASKTQASIMPSDPTAWDYFITSVDKGVTWDVKQNAYNYRDPSWNGNTVTIYNRFSAPDFKILALELKYDHEITLVPTVKGNGSWVSHPSVVVAQGGMDVTYYWTISPQPALETITFPSGWSDGLKQMDIATKCFPVPEPSTYFAGLSALGLLGMFGWRNRK